MTRRRWVYPSDGSPPYEVDLRPQRKPSVNFVQRFDPVEGSDGRIIHSKKELERQNANGKSIHLEEMNNVAMDAHNERLRQDKLDKQRRKQTIIDAVNRYG
jgi:hypothetical protein